MVVGGNGTGKSTLASFIKAMFYGLPHSTKRSVSENPRKHFTPWQGGKFGGYIDVTVDENGYGDYIELKVRLRSTSKMDVYFSGDSFVNPVTESEHDINVFGDFSKDYIAGAMRSKLSMTPPPNTTFLGLMIFASAATDFSMPPYPKCKDKIAIFFISLPFCCI